MLGFGFLATARSNREVPRETFGWSGRADQRNISFLDALRLSHIARYHVVILQSFCPANSGRLLWSR